MNMKILQTTVSGIALALGLRSSTKDSAVYVVFGPLLLHGS